jgi:hypothetical protein
MEPESSEAEVVPVVPLSGAKVWVHVLVVVGLAVLAQAVGLGFAYVFRCKPGQGNEWCGLSSITGALLGFAAAVVILIAGSITIVIKRRHHKASGGKVGVLRVLAVVLGALLVLPCGWMLGFGWARMHNDGGLWLGLALGLGLIAVAFVRRHRA